MLTSTFNVPMRNPAPEGYTNKNEYHTLVGFCFIYYFLCCKLKYIGFVIRIDFFWTSVKYYNYAFLFLPRGAFFKVKVVVYRYISIEVVSSRFLITYKPKILIRCRSSSRWRFQAYQSSSFGVVFGHQFHTKKHFLIFTKLWVE